MLSRVEALAYLEAGRTAEALHAAHDSLEWQRGPQEQSDAWITIARIDHQEGRPTAARESLDQARRLWPENPRLQSVAFWMP